MTAVDMRAALRHRFRAPRWGLLFEVRSRTGFAGEWYGNVRSADEIAMGVEPSCLELHGIEVKRSRGDWLRELRDPAKAAEVMRYCDRWWLATSSAEIVRPEELPPGWGLLVVRGDGKLVQRVAAPKLEAEPVTREFLAAMFRKLSKEC